MERARRFERPTPTLARLCSTPELRPRSGAAGPLLFRRRGLLQRGGTLARRRGPRAASEPQLHRLHAAAVGVGLGRRAAVVGQLAAEIVALPGRLHRLGLAAVQRLVEVVALLAPGLVLAEQRLVRLQALLHQLERLQLAVLRQGDEAERLALGEA